jgi:hypothetical protein
MATPNVPTVNATTPVQSKAGQMKKYAIHKRQKKTAANPKGESLLMITFAPSLEAAAELADQMINQGREPNFRVEEIA